MSRTIYVLPDTNVLMQCLPLGELPWSQEFPEAETVVVVLVMPVMREIDRQKGGQGRLAKRARIVSGLIGKLIDVEEVCLPTKFPVTLKLISADGVRPDPAIEHELDYAQADDAIVGAASSFAKAYSERMVRLLSNDTGVLLSARRVGVPFHKVPAQWLLPAESDDEQKRLKALESEVKRLRSDSPECVIEPLAEPWNFTVERYEPLSDAQVDALVVMLREKFPEATDFGPSEPATRDPNPGVSTLHSLYGREEFVPASKSAIANYRQDQYPGWISRCAEYLRKLNHKLNENQRFPHVSVDLVNDGARPAEDVRVSFSIKGGDLLIKLPVDDGAPCTGRDGADSLAERQVDKERLELPSPPTAPSGHWRKVKVFDPMGAAVGSILSAIPHQPSFPALLNTRAPPAFEQDAFYWKAGMRPERALPTTELTCQQWRHRAKPERFEFEIVSPMDMQLRRGALVVEVHASNLADPVEKTIPVEICPVPGDTWDEARALVDLLTLPPVGLRLTPR